VLHRLAGLARLLRVGEPALLSSFLSQSAGLPFSAAYASFRAPHCGCDRPDLALCALVDLLAYGLTYAAPDGPEHFAALLGQVLALGEEVAKAQPSPQHASLALAQLVTLGSDIFTYLTLTDAEVRAHEGLRSGGGVCGWCGG
jgi:hypothetical protein